MNKAEGGEIDPQEMFGKLFGGGELLLILFLNLLEKVADALEAFLDYIGEISLIKDFTSTMDAVLTEEEKAAMEQAEMEAEAEATGTKESVSGATAATNAGSSGFTTPTTAAAGADGATAVPEPGTHLAHHSSFSKGQTGTAATETPGGADGVAKKPAAVVEDKKKGKAKLTPEQRVKLDELEAKRDEEKEKRYVAHSLNEENSRRRKERPC